MSCFDIRYSMRWENYVIDVLGLNLRNSPDNICLTYSLSCHAFQVIYEDRFCDKIDGVELYKFYCNDLTVNSYLLCYGCS